MRAIILKGYEMRQAAIVMSLVLMTVIGAGSAAAANDKGVVGKWNLTHMEVNGQKIGVEQIGKLTIELTKDGKMQSWKDGKEDEKGFYELKEGGILIGYTDEDGDGVLDEEEKADAEEMKYTRDGKTLSFTMEMKIEGNPPFKMKMVFNLAE